MRLQFAVICFILLIPSAIGLYGRRYLKRSGDQICSTFQCNSAGGGSCNTFTGIPPCASSAYQTFMACSSSGPSCTCTTAYLTSLESSNSTFCVSLASQIYASCVQMGCSCGTPPVSPALVGCNMASYCSKQEQCQAALVDGSNCNATSGPCINYCKEGVCGWARYPKDTCSLNSDCASGSCSSSVCTGFGSGSSCNFTAQCNFGYYCSAGQCKATVNSGISCTSTEQCSPPDQCSTTGVCFLPYQLNSGSACSYPEQCGIGLICNNQSKCGSPDLSISQVSCRKNSDCSSFGVSAFCQCDQQTGVNSCQYIDYVLPACKSALVGFGECAYLSGCINTNPFDPNSCASQLCGANRGCAIVCELPSPTNLNPYLTGCLVVPPYSCSSNINIPTSTGTTGTTGTQGTATTGQSVSTATTTTTSSDANRLSVASLIIISLTALFWILKL